jgi:regulator of sirC expression with transglutaminase-like and TPR domain
MTETTTPVLAYFGALVADDEDLPVTEAALALAQDAYPDLDLQGELAEFDRLAARLRRRLPQPAGARERLAALNGFFFRELGFSCNRNDYYDPDNSYLNAVLKRRLGIPISLAVLYLELGAQIGLTAHGVSFPGHFLVRVSLPEGDAVIDPTTGRSLSEARLLEMLEPYAATDTDPASLLHALLLPASGREIIARMLNNLKAVYQQAERWQRLLAVQQRLVILLPGQADEVRDRGFAYARLEYTRAALNDLEWYLGECPDAADATRVETEAALLRKRLALGGEGRQQ